MSADHAFKNASNFSNQWLDLRTATEYPTDSMPISRICAIEKSYDKPRTSIFSPLTFVQEACVGYVRRSRSSTPFLLVSIDLFH